MNLRSKNVSCCVNGCGTKKESNPELQFHKFPKKNQKSVQFLNSYGFKQTLDRRAVWEIKLKLNNIDESNMFVCSKHFKQKDYKNKAKYKNPKLKKDAIPTKNLSSEKIMNDIETWKLTDDELKDVVELMDLKEKLSPEITTLSTSTLKKCDTLDYKFDVILF